ncbi:conserved hypothetical protein [Ricinus communis]|uniref:RING-type E3 ubiquitin transferase n=1 Tax=Ricinus communis TaxID=3988 RepID=B9T0E0_RICCO|nr:conserved hypothetical protein [Ricinus communis]
MICSVFLVDGRNDHCSNKYDSFSDSVTSPAANMSARLNFWEDRTLWFYDKTTLLLSLPFYGAGILMVLLNNISINTNIDFILKSCADVLIDGFLLPQFFLNLLRSSKENALAYRFYMGTTLLQLIQHLYNVYRFYNHDLPCAHPDGDCYSLTWDFLIYLQQKFGVDYVFVGKNRKLEVIEKGIAARDD